MIFCQRFEADAKLMRTVAYLYYDAAWEDRPNPSAWGWQFDAVYEDTDPRRSQLQALLVESIQDPPAFLVLRHLEELGDSLAAVTRALSQLESLGVCVVALEQAYRSQAPARELDGQHVESAPERLALFNGIQQQQRSRQIRQGHALNRLKGLPPPGKAPYGYRRGRDRYAIDRSVAPVLRDFYDHFLIYGSVRGAVRHIAKKHNKKISPSTGQRWLTHPVYRGDLLHRAAIQPDTHPPILLRAEAAQVDRLLRRNQSVAPRAASAPRSLSGLVTCQQCQSSMSVSRVTNQRQTREYLYLRPTTCSQRPKCKALQYEEVLAKTIETICQTLPQEVAGLTQIPLDRIAAGVMEAIADKQRAIAQLPDLVEQQILDEKTANLRTYTLRAEIAELQSKLAQLPPVNLLETAKTVSIPQFWQDLSEPERRFYFREFIRSIEIARDGAQWSIQLRFMF
ncbi:recombinase zinc beta ribbon domain-containing protein [Altericista sp. CCNU0014]|uniref:recombinase zinc beta ribbon domain-containing protein n=1 Tax=Altericista sp. CCNU0014 TaxID=3082949 RepID=UPI00384F4D23